MSNQQSATNQRSLTGFITKLVGDGATYGFINDEIFFPQTNVTGGPASVGDQVFAECEYTAHLPIKWNATSVKILNKAGNQQQAKPDHQQTDLMNQQQFNQGDGSVAVTYQQHRQQRQQRQMLDIKQPDSNMKQAPHQQNTDLTTKLLEHTNNPGSEFFGQGQSRPFAPQMDNNNIQPFQDQPMGPPNFTYTSQLGSAFVQNQFVPTPFIAQPPPMLPQQTSQQPQQPPPPQHLLPPNQPTHNQNNQRHNNKNGGRFDNHNEKNDRQNNRRNQNRNNNNKFDRPRSGERDGSLQNNSNNRNQKSNGSRERSLNRNNRRDETSSRASPQAHSSARSTTSMGSDRGTKSRRHYEVQNIPKTRIMTNMNAYNMKQRCPSSVHVPSDLKDIIVNEFFRLDIKNTPKPIKYLIEQTKEEANANDETTTGAKVVDGEATETSKNQEVEEMSTTQADLATKQESTGTDPQAVVKAEEKQDVKPQEQPTPPSSKSDSRLNHKYGVKVILLSMPELEAIYRSVFGTNLDSFNTDVKPTQSRLDETISLLCNKGQNNGYSLIGGKFDPVLDGFIEGKVNEFERHGRQPDLIATCKRVVQEQTGLDLSSCRSWTLLSTFMYNNRSDYFSPKASVEYSFIYVPQVWTMLSDKFEKNIKGQEINKLKLEEPTSVNNEPIMESSETSAMEVKETTAMEVQETTAMEVKETTAPSKDSVDEEPLENSEDLASSTAQEQTSGITAENLADLKVNDLKAELDRRNIKYKTGVKKAELISMLQESLKPIQLTTEKEEVVKDEGDTNTVEEQSKLQLEEGEVEADPSEDSTEPEGDASTETNNKRKASDVENEEPESKKVCTDTSTKEQRVELIQEALKVYARTGQQQLTLISLHEAAQAARHDQFELSVASNILKESLIQHLSEYMLTTLVEDNKQRLSIATGNLGSHSTSSSQETNSDTNNNNTKSSFKNPTSSEPKVSLKEYPIDRYINLAFSYFDSNHMGYVYFEDLNKLFNNTGLTISKRALISLVGDGEKFNYKTLPELSTKLPPTYIYEFPEQFRRLPLKSGSSSEQKNLTTDNYMVEYKGVMYDVAKLVQQVREAETLRVSLVDRFNYAIENSDRQAEEIHVLEVSQKSLAKAIKAQNDEICDLKRERDLTKKKYENVRKGIKGTISSLSDLIKDDEKK